MKVRTTAIIAAGCAVLAFLSGAWVSYRSSRHAEDTSRKVLYYVDPMHPSYKSDKPGVAPDCGMQLEPVYADGGKGAAPPAIALPPGAVSISSEQMQSIGVKVATVEKSGTFQIIRVPGRVTPDERRVYRLTAAVTGWVQSIGKATTGDTVKKNETLLSFYAPDFLAAIQSYIYALGSLDRTMATQGRASVSQLEVNNLNLHNYRYTLRNLGMSELQMDEIAKTREPTENIRVMAPADGLVLSRNVYPGLKFDGGTEFYRIADISKVWVLADTYGSEADQLKPGTLVKVSIPNRNRVYSAKVSSVPPIFNQNSRTLQVRLELDNPGLILRPEMFVDVELPIRLPSMLSVPAEALLDSGLKKTVYVEKSPGIFEPREVETGRTFGDRVEIVSGLKEGERIASSGTFLLDSESRMQSSSAGISGTPHQDPVCGMYVDEAKAKAAGLTVNSGGTIYYFCSPEDKNLFLKNPTTKKNMEGMPESAAPAAMKKHEGHSGRAMPTSPSEKAGNHDGHRMPMKMQSDMPQKMPMEMKMDKPVEAPKETPMKMPMTAPPASAPPHGSGMKHD